MRRYAPLIGLGSGVLVGIVLAFLAAAAAGAGHGTYLPARLLFPFAMFSTFLFGSITAPFIVIGLIQFPAYGLLSGVSYRLHRFRAGLLVIAAAHFLAVALNFIIRSEHFPNALEKPSQPVERMAAGEPERGGPPPFVSSVLDQEEIYTTDFTDCTEGKIRPCSMVRLSNPTGCRQRRDRVSLGNSTPLPGVPEPER